MTLDAVRKAEAIWGGEFNRRKQPAEALTAAETADEEAGE